MPRPKIHTHYQDRIRTLTAQHMSARAITEELEQEAARRDWLDPPDGRTVRRYIEQFRERAELDQAQYARFEWPESMETADLPWEASRTVLDYLRHCRNDSLYLYGRPSVRMVTWYWRVHQAATDGSEDDWEWGASYLTDSESDPTEAGRSIARAVESYLAYAPWQWDYGSSDHEDIARTLKELFRENGVGYDWQPGTEPPIRMDRLHRFIEVVRKVRKMPRDLAPNGVPLDMPEERWLWYSENLEAAGLYLLDERRSRE